MKSRIVRWGVFAAAAFSAAMPLVAKSDYHKLLDGKKGSATEGPGKGMGGVLTADGVQISWQTVIDLMMENINNLSDENNKLEEAKKAQEKEMQEAIGSAAVEGMQLEDFQYQKDPMELVTRKMYLENLKSSPDAGKHAATILYFESLQAHETRMDAFASRLNTLIAANNGKLDWEQRVRLQAQFGLLQGQWALAEQQMREVRNRALISGHSARMEDAVAERNEKRKARMKQAISNAIE